MRLAYAVAAKYYSLVANFAEYEDVESMCVEWLILAAKTFDASKGFAFSTYAYSAIKNNLLRFKNIQYQKLNGKVIVSLDKELTDDEFTLADVLPLDYDLEEEISNNSRYNDLYKFINELPYMVKNVILLHLQRE